MVYYKMESMIEGEKNNTQLMSVKDLASYLGLGKQTIYNWLKEKKISGMKIGKVWRFDRQEIERWLRESCLRKNS